MAIEFGVAATWGTAAELLAALSGPAVMLSLGEPVASIDQVPQRIGDFGPVVAGDLDGCGFVMDGDLQFLDPDKIVEASRRLRRLVIGIAGDADRGRYWLCVAESGMPTRVHWTCIEDQTEPFDEGWLLRSEIVEPLDDVSGWGLFAALKSFGFDYGAWCDRGSKAMVETVGDHWMTGPIATRIKEFAAAHRPIGWVVRKAVRPLP
jgi:hypothetical protein